MKTLLDIFPEITGKTRELLSSDNSHSCRLGIIILKKLYGGKEIVKRIMESGGDLPTFIGDFYNGAILECMLEDLWEGEFPHTKLGNTGYTMVLTAKKVYILDKYYPLSKPF